MKKIQEEDKKEEREGKDNEGEDGGDEWDNEDDDSNQGGDESYGEMSPEDIELLASPHPKHIVIKTSKQIAEPSTMLLAEATLPASSSNDIFGSLSNLDIPMASLLWEFSNGFSFSSGDIFVEEGETPFLTPSEHGP